MNGIHQLLDRFVQNELALSQSQITQGSTSHNRIREILTNRSNRDSNFPRLISGDFLSGSYARGTKIHPLDDIDVMMVIDGSGLFASHNGQQLNASIRGMPDPSTNPIHQHLDPSSKLLSSKRILEIFKDSLKETYPNTRVTNDQQAVNVTFSFNIGVDIVPCFHIVPNDGSRDFYYIAEGATGHGWLATNPRIDNEISDRLHTKHGDCFKGAIRLFKYWNRVFNQDRLRSYHLETLVWHMYDKDGALLDDYETGLINIMLQAQTMLANPCTDKTLIGAPVDSYLLLDDRNKSMQALDESMSFLRQAYTDPQANEETVTSAWNKIFDEKLT